MLHLAVANGFPPETYRPLLDGLGCVIAIPPRALWPDIGPPPEAPGSWEVIAGDMIAGLTAHRKAPVIAVGHSFGAVASLIVAVREPGLVRALVLLDPTIFPRPQMDEFAREKAAGRTPRLALVDTALKRKSEFTSHAEAFVYWRGKDLFRDWSDSALERYAHAMLKPGGTQGWVLTWPPAWEAWYYRSFYPHTWDLVPQLDRSIPLLVVAGETSDTFRSEAIAELRKLRPDSTFATVPAGHLFPQSHPESARAIMAPWLASIVMGR